MIDKVRFSYCERDTVLVKSFKGGISFQEYIDAWLKVRGLRMLQRNVKGVISDFSNCEFNIEEEDLDELFVFFQKNINFVVNLKLALVIDSPKVAVMTLFIKKYKIDQIKIFSSKISAMDWIYSDT